MARRPANPIELRRQIAELGAKGSYREAAQAADRALVATPNDAELHLLRALAAERLGEWKKLLAHAERFEALAPAKAPMDISAGWALLQLGRVAEAKVRLDRAVERHPTNATGWMNLGIAEKRLGDIHRAEFCQRRAIELGPDLPQPRLNLAVLLQECGDPESALAVVEELLARRPNERHAAGYRAFLSLLVPDVVPAELRRRAEQAGAALLAGVDPVLASPRFRQSHSPSAHAKQLRIGFFSADFRDHSVASFALPLIESLDRRQIEAVLFSSASAPDSVTAAFARAAPVVDISRLDSSALVANARAKELDVAIDLGGHSQGNSLAAFAARVAPVQVTYLGYAGTTGLSTMDARLVDSTTDVPDPAGPPDRHAACSERVFRLDPCFLCWRSRVEAELPERAESDCDRPVVFGSFNDLAKLSDPTLALWSRILARVPGSRLFLKSYGLGLARARERLLTRLNAAGIASERVDMLAWTATHLEHLKLYGRVDVALDCVPYNGTTTTCEALWMGTPVVTLEGAVHHARVGASLLRAVGRDDLVARTPEEYVERAVTLASQRHTHDRAALRAEVQRSPLRDEAGFARRFETAIRSLWITWCTSQGSRPGAPSR